MKTLPESNPSDWSPHRRWCVATLLLMTMSLWSGCVGYNHTLFMTKSNVGLDLDTKPPTAEINISRKEGVIAPTFEGGKTPPVMASFGGANGSQDSTISRFFFGVNQTFAGGDAALTMGKLYGTNTPVPADDAAEAALRAQFDSTLTLTKKPRAIESRSRFRKYFFGLPEPGEVRPLVFVTDTQLGLKVGWTGASTAIPETVKIGFNRKEAAVAPVTMTERVTNGVTSYHVRMPSFLATVDTDVTGGKGVQVDWIQYFATGEAADHLARQKEVRKAMLGRADPAQEKLMEDAEDQKQQAEAVKEAKETTDQIDAILAKVIKDGKAVEALLQTVSKDVQHLNPKGDQWAQQFKDKDAPALRANLEGLSEDAVPALYTNSLAMPLP